MRTRITQNTDTFHAVKINQNKELTDITQKMKLKSTKKIFTRERKGRLFVQYHISMWHIYLHENFGAYHFSL